ncbi:glycosyltransferase [Streptomyces apocyni]|uniref:glycosyltransferase n=1 Tax=Streptomyces apocyni TaxID=2654677 RepID=UPI001E32843B|nr:glycosyltransferase [Streptomyces apocyni]
MTAKGKPSGGPLSVAVLIELVRSPSSGGQVKCWERFAEAAAEVSPAELGVDLTLYVLGDRHRVESLSPHVRFVSLRPVISTASISRKGGVDVSDIAPHHAELARLLPRHEVWHVTHTLAFASTAVRLSRRQRRGARERSAGSAGMVGSIHTDVPAVTEAFVRAVVDRRLRRVPVLDSFDAAARCAALVRRRRDRILNACDRIMVATPSQQRELAAVVGPERLRHLGRGIDRHRFRPDASARAELSGHGVPRHRTTVLFAGRVDASKRVLLLAEAVRRLRDEGSPVHLVVAGTGPDAAAVSALLGPDVTLLGALPQEQLARVCAGCDIFAFPSLTETIGNVVGEAMACGVPVVLPNGTRTNQWLSSPGEDGLLVDGDTPGAWATALAGLVDAPAARAAMGRRALATSLARHRGWGQVLTDDLLPVWRSVAADQARAWSGAGG